MTCDARVRVPSGYRRRSRDRVKACISWTFDGAERTLQAPDAHAISCARIVRQDETSAPGLTLPSL
jgi:hypothetical protein